MFEASVPYGRAPSMDGVQLERIRQLLMERIIYPPYLLNDDGSMTQMNIYTWALPRM